MIKKTNSFARKIPHATNPLTIEILAAREGLGLAIQHNWQHVIMESDALQVVQAIGSLNCGSSATRLLLDDIKTSLRGFDC